MRSRDDAAVAQLFDVEQLFNEVEVSGGYLN